MNVLFLQGVNLYFKNAYRMQAHSLSNKTVLNQILRLLDALNKKEDQAPPLMVIDNLLKGKKRVEKKEMQHQTTIKL